MKHLLTASLCVLGLAGCLGQPAGAAPSAAATASAPAACVAPDPAALRSTWSAFRAATLAGKPEQAAKFYKFPLKLMGPMDSDRPLSLSKPVFLKNYAALFQTGPAGDEIGLLSALKSASDNDKLPTARFDEQHCRTVQPARVRDYNFAYDPQSGWQIVSVYYGVDYPTAKDAELDR